MTRFMPRARGLLLAAGLAAAPALLSGCQTSCTGDARFDGYYCARGNLSDGTYDRQTAALGRLASQRQGEAASLRRRYEAAEARLRAARASAATPPGELLALENEVESLRRAVRRAAG